MTQLLPGIDIRIVDVSGLLNDIVAHSQNYGLANVTNACVRPNQAERLSEESDGIRELQRRGMPLSPNTEELRALLEDVVGSGHR